jgi:hypothetical protein
VQIKNVRPNEHWWQCLCIRVWLNSLCIKLEVAKIWMLINVIKWAPQAFYRLQLVALTICELTKKCSNRLEFFFNTGCSFWFCLHACKFLDLRVEGV